MKDRDYCECGNCQQCEDFIKDCFKDEVKNFVLELELNLNKTTPLCQYKVLEDDGYSFYIQKSREKFSGKKQTFKIWFELDIHSPMTEIVKKVRVWKEAN